MIYCIVLIYQDKQSSTPDYMLIQKYKSIDDIEEKVIKELVTKDLNLLNQLSMDYLKIQIWVAGEKLKNSRLLFEKEYQLIDDFEEVSNILSFEYYREKLKEKKDDERSKYL